jgi:iron complex transport system substrate-binding protein
LPRLGGPKNPRLQDIIQLKPDLIFANQEENTRDLVEVLDEAGLLVWVTFPQTVDQAIDVLWGMVEIFKDHPSAALASVEVAKLQANVVFLREIPQGRSIRYFCPIWLGEALSDVGWWMTFNRHTFAHDILSLAGGENIFADRRRKYPLAADLGLGPESEDITSTRDQRYPRVTLREIMKANPALILLPDEPFMFNETHRQAMLIQLPDVGAVKRGAVKLIEGSFLTWHGTRLGKALSRLPEIIQAGG